MSEQDSTHSPPATSPSATGDAAIEARGLTRSFGEDVEAVRGIDLQIERGEIFGFLGPNGAGKTTTLRMFCTLLPPSSGNATIDGLDVDSNGHEVRKRIGVALQEIGLDPAQTGRELLELQCGLYGIEGSAAVDRATELLDIVELSDAADRRIKGYSGGMKRRLDLAASLVHKPKILFLDEPTTGLDPASRRTIWDQVREINEGGATVFLTTQYLEEADELCDRLAIIDEGKIVAEGEPAALKAEIGNDVVSIELDGADAAATRDALEGLEGLERMVDGEGSIALFVEDGAGSIVEIVRRLDGITVGAISVARPTLDDVFLEATGKRLAADDSGGGHDDGEEAH